MAKKFSFTLDNIRTEEDRNKVKGQLKGQSFFLKVKNKISGRRFAFLTNQPFTCDIFLHCSQCPDFDQLNNGDEVTAQVELKLNKDSWKFNAINARKKGIDPSGAKLSSTDCFYNPYTFVPTPPRNTIPADSFAGDQDPLPLGLVHHHMASELWSGTLTINVKLVTPLVLPAPDPDEENEHKTYACKISPDTSEIRGMLRSAYETVTNSRYHGFTRGKNATHTTRLGLRADTGEAVKLVPARVVKNSTGDLELALMPGVSAINPNRGPRVMYAAWLPRYKKYSRSTTAIREDKHERPGKEALPFAGSKPPAIPKHRERVFFSCTRQTHSSGRFEYLRVDEIIDPGTVTGKPAGYHEGYVCITGRNMMNKHWERVFFNAGKLHSAILDADVIVDYELLVRDYRQLHKDERPLADMNKYKGHDPGETGFSRHVWADGEEKLKEGDLLFARIKEKHGGYEATAMYPVMMSRQLYPLAPADLLPESLKHAGKIEELSPADRLFGWVASAKGKGRRAYRGRIMVEVPRKESLQRYEFSEHLTLPILGEPRPHNGRFYVAKDKNGSAQDANGTKLKKGYCDKTTKGLRGRKQYWHHQGKEYSKNSKNKNYWHPREPSDIPREYMGSEKGKQNRSLKAWLAPGQEMTFRLHLHNATDQELGALFWLLSLPEKHYFRLGYGKPLGFGSLELSLDSVNVAQGEDWRSYYKNLFALPPSGPDEKTRGDLMQSFMQAMVTTYPKAAIKNSNQASESSSLKDTSFSALSGCKGSGSGPASDSSVQTAPDYRPDFLQLPFVAGFLRVASGPGNKGPIHYPRTKAPDSKVFNWFGENEAGRTEWVDGQKEKHGAKKLCLPHVTEDADNSLPSDPTN